MSAEEVVSVETIEDDFFDNTENENYWTTQEASRKLGVGIRTIFKKLKDGSLKGEKVPGRFGDEWRIEPPADYMSTTTAPATEHVLGHDSRYSDEDWLDLIERKDQAIQQAAFRNGYLEAQIENKNQEVKLLTDQSKNSEILKKELLKVKSELEEEKQKAAVAKSLEDELVALKVKNSLLEEKEQELEQLKQELAEKKQKEENDRKSSFLSWFIGKQ